MNYFKYLISLSIILTSTSIFSTDPLIIKRPTNAIIFARNLSEINARPKLLTKYMPIIIIAGIILTIYLSYQVNSSKYNKFNLIDKALARFKKEQGHYPKAIHELKQPVSIPLIEEKCPASYYNLNFENLCFDNLLYELYNNYYILNCESADL